MTSLTFAILAVACAVLALGQTQGRDAEVGRWILEAALATGWEGEL